MRAASLSIVFCLPLLLALACGDNTDPNGDPTPSAGSSGDRGGTAPSNPTGAALRFFCGDRSRSP